MYPLTGLPRYAPCAAQLPPQGRLEAAAGRGTDPAYCTPHGPCWSRQSISPRAWAVQAVFAGALSVEAIRKAWPATRTLATESRTGWGISRDVSCASGGLSGRYGAPIPTECTRPKAFSAVAVRETESQYRSGPVRVLHRCCSGTKPSPSVDLSTRQAHFPTIHRCCSGTPIQPLPVRSMRGGREPKPSSERSVAQATPAQITQTHRAARRGHPASSWGIGAGTAMP
jgi:hypothetical protein